MFKSVYLYIYECTCKYVCTLPSLSACTECHSENSDWNHVLRATGIALCMCECVCVIQIFVWVLSRICTIPENAGIRRNERKRTYIPTFCSLHFHALHGSAAGSEPAS